MRDHEITGCEFLACMAYQDRKCHNPLDYVNEDTGEDMCPLNIRSIPREDYLEKRAAEGN
jgi:hypothetical protein